MATKETSLLSRYLCKTYGREAEDHVCSLLGMVCTCVLHELYTIWPEHYFNSPVTVHYDANKRPQTSLGIAANNIM